jgi:VWFA-related protein
MPSASTPALALTFAALAAAASAQDIRFEDSIDVERVIFDARVVDGYGRPVLGLSPADFRITVDGRDVAVESAQWMTAPGYPRDPRAAPSAAAPEGRLVVLFFQKDLDASRAPGLLRMADQVGGIVGRLGDADRVAVASYDSRLRLWTDFTSDRATVDAAIRAVLVGGDPAPPRRGEPSLVAHLDLEASLRADTPEQALRVLAHALKEVPGSKSVVLVGHGFAIPEPAVRRVLEDARAAVFALDVTNADSHTLEAGLQQVAEDTGGFYARTHVFAGQAVARLESALAGHYVLTFPRPVLPVGEHAVEIRLVGRKGTVLAKRTYRG